jgi:ATP adenylyltransferase
MRYIEGREQREGCFFCASLQEKDGPDNLVLYRGKRAFAILNRYPYNNGHMMIVPYKHVPTLDPLPQATLNELMLMTRTAMQVLARVYGAENFNVGMNIGEAAGAGVADHVHIHVLPRWPGDTNFMATTAHTRVLPEAIPDTYARLRQGWKELTRS